MLNKYQRLVTSKLQYFYFISKFIDFNFIILWEWLLHDFIFM